MFFGKGTRFPRMRLKKILLNLIVFYLAISCVEFRSPSTVNGEQPVSNSKAITPKKIFQSTLFYFKYKNVCRTMFF